MTIERLNNLMRKAYAAGEAFSRKGNGLHKTGRYNLPQIHRSIRRFLISQSHVQGYEGELEEAWMSGFADHARRFRAPKQLSTRQQAIKEAP